MLEHGGGGEMRVIVTSGLVREQQVVDADYEEAETVPTKLIGTNGGSGNGSQPTQRRTGDKVGRNDPCPCGSGKKYKKCHGVEA